MRPDNPKCETCVAWNPDGGYCHRKTIARQVSAKHWCMKHETPEEWQAKRSVPNSRLNLSTRIAELESHTGGPND